MDLQEHWLAHCKRGKLQELRCNCLRRLKEGARLPISETNSIGLPGWQTGLWSTMDWVVLQHNVVKFRRFMSQSGISFTQQAAWEEAIVTALAHTVHAAWKILAENIRIITAAGGDTGHPWLQEDGTLQEATWMDGYLNRSSKQSNRSQSKRTRPRSVPRHCSELQHLLRNQSMSEIIMATTSAVLETHGRSARL